MTLFAQEARAGIGVHDVLALGPAAAACVVVFAFLKYLSDQRKLERDRDDKYADSLARLAAVIERLEQRQAVHDSHMVSALERNTEAFNRSSATGDRVEHVLERIEQTLEKKADECDN